MILTSQMLYENYKDYTDIKGKISRSIKKKELFSIAKGKYETDKNTNLMLLSGYIYGPSYISFEYALSYYGLIPERVYEITSATFNKRRQKYFSNYFGNFSYKDVPTNVFPFEINYFIENGYSYQIATKEKALCDMLYKVAPVRSIKELKLLLFDNLRIDLNEFNKLNKNKILELAPLYNSSNLSLLAKLIKKGI